MEIMEVYLDKKKSFNLSIEEFAVMQNVYTFMGRLGYNKDSFIEDLEIFLDDDEGMGNEMNLNEKTAIRILIPKIKTLTDSQVKQINEAFEKSEALFDIFYFVDPLKRLDYFEPALELYKESYEKIPGL